jgi:GGDEF domain-containing protein
MDGRQAGLLLLRLLIDRPRTQRFNLVGHSIGCRVLCAALQALAEDASLLARFAGSEFNVALLQPDADSDPLAAGQLGIPKLRLLIATSDLDNLAVPVDQRFDVTSTAVPTFTARLGVADLTPLHDCVGELDINRAPVYELLARFFGQ